MNTKLKSGPPVDLKLPDLQSFFSESWYPSPQLYQDLSFMFQAGDSAFHKKRPWPSQATLSGDRRKEKPGMLIHLHAGCFRKLAIMNN